MGWRTILIKSRAKLDYNLNFMTVRRDLETKKISISEIYMLIIEDTAVSITAVLLNELMKNKVKIVFCDEKRNPSGELIPYYGAHDTSLKYKNQLNWSEESKCKVWTEIVYEKIKNQSKLLEKFKLNGSELLREYMQEIMYNDSTNREGHAAKVYFNSLYGMEFNRKKECFINSCLDYGYSIILSAFTREIVANGYFTQLGICHRNMYNQFNLASDLMEPFRPLVDETVFLFEEKLFSREHKISLVDILNRPLCISGRQQIVLNAIKIYCKGIFNALNENDMEYLEFFDYEL